MLDQPDDPAQLEQMLACLECGVELPHEWQRFFDMRGPLPTCMPDERSFPRFHFRGRAVVKYHQTLPTLSRSERWFCVFTKDVSRSGLSLLHSDQMFPREVLEIWLPGGTTAKLVVTRARQRGSRCYEIGARFQSQTDRTNSETTQLGGGA